VLWNPSPPSTLPFLQPSSSSVVKISGRAVEFSRLRSERERVPVDRDDLLEGGKKIEEVTRSRTESERVSGRKSGEGGGRSNSPCPRDRPSSPRPRTSPPWSRSPSTPVVSSSSKSSCGTSIGLGLLSFRRGSEEKRREREKRRGSAREKGRRETKAREMSSQHPCRSQISQNPRARRRRRWELQPSKWKTRWSPTRKSSKRPEHETAKARVSASRPRSEGEKG